MITRIPDTCPACGAPLPPDAPRGLCPVCVFELDDATVNSASSASAPDSPFCQNRRFADYELLEEIARGGMGVVYKARQLSLNRIVAVKMIVAGQFAGKQLVQRFRAEVTAAALLRHPNIVAIHEVGVHGDQHFYSMDYVEGPNLAQLVRAQPLSARQAARYVRIIADATHYAHQQGILHRDLKPSNVLVDSATDQPRLTDFGLAKRLDGDLSLTLSGQVLGSPNFMPPEQARGDKGHFGRHSDVYGLGAILYYILTGRPPFQAESLESTIHQVIHAEPVAPRLLQSSLPPDLETICLKCLEKEPSRRYQTAQEVADELGRFLEDKPIQARPVSRLQWTWRWAKRNPALSTSLATVVILLLAIGIGSPIAALRFNKERQRAEATRARAEAQAYTSDMNVVLQAWEEGNLDRAQDLLRAHIPARGERDLRSLEWRYLWKLCQDESLRTIRLHPGDARTLLFLKDANLLAVGGGKGVKLFTANDYAPAGELQDHGASMQLLAMSPALSQSIAAAGANGSLVRIWDVRSKSITARFQGADGRIDALAFSPDGQFLAWTSEQSGIELWDVRAQTNLWRRRPEHPSRTLTFSPDSRVLVSGGSKEGGNTLFWDSRTGETLPPLPAAQGGWVVDCVFSPDGKTLATAALDSSILLWDFPNRRKLRGLADRDAHVAFSPDGRQFATGGGYGVVYLWDLSQPDRPPTLKRGHRGGVSAVAFAPDGQTLVSSSWDGAIKIWPVAPPADQNLLFHGEHWVTTLSLSPDGNLLAAGDYHANRAIVFDLSSRRLLGYCGGHSSAVQGTAFSPNGQWLATGSEDETVRLWNTATLQLERVLTNDFPSTMPAFSPSSRVLAVASWMPIAIAATNTLSFWDPGTGQKLNRLPDAAPLATSAAFSHSGSLLATGYRNGSVRIWDWAQQRLISEYANPGNGFVWSLVFSADDRVLASGSSHIILYDLKSRQTAELPFGSGTLAFSRDAKSLVSVADRWLMFWNLTTCGLALRVPIHPSPTSGLVITPVESLIVTSGADGAIRLWPLAATRDIPATQ